MEGIKNVLDLCHQIKNLECLIHVSTAYSFCNRRIIDEKIYPLSFTLEEFKDVVKLVAFLFAFTLIYLHLHLLLLLILLLLVSVYRKVINELKL